MERQKTALNLANQRLAALQQQMSFRRSFAEQK
jgi:hypothetical protein